ncbi:flagellar biosynthesis anti-sigma factor FlgM [Bdellovibrionota bacterium FG-2]
MRVNQTGNNSIQGADVANTRQAGNAAATQNAKKTGKSKVTDTSSSTDSAKTELSARGKEFAKAKAVASQAPDVREEKIAELKRRISAGKYEVNADAVADKLVDEHLKTADLG